MQYEQGLSVVLPCYKEAERGNFDERLRTVRDYLNSLDFKTELICVLDGMDMASLHSCTKYADKVLHFKKNHGKGAALRFGFQNARFNRIMFMDADLSVPIYNISKFYELMNKGRSLIIGNRVSKSKRSIPRILLSRLSHMVTYILLGIKCEDTQCGFKMFDHEVYSHIAKYIKSDRWLFDIELLMYMKALGIYPVSVKVDWQDDLPSTLVSSKAIKTSCTELLSILKRRRRSIREIQNKFYFLLK